jgi:hypothetical protein
MLAASFFNFEVIMAQVSNKSLQFLFKHLIVAKFKIIIILILIVFVFRFQLLSQISNCDTFRAQR